MALKGLPFVLTGFFLFFVSFPAYAGCSFNDTGDFICDEDSQAPTTSDIAPLYSGDTPDQTVSPNNFDFGGPVNNLSGEYDRLFDLQQTLSQAQDLASLAETGLSPQQLQALADAGLSGVDPSGITLADYEVPDSVKEASEKALVDDGTTGDDKHLEKGSVCDLNEDRPIDSAAKSGISDLSARHQILNRFGFRKSSASGEGDSANDNGGNADAKAPIAGQHLAYGRGGMDITMEYNDKTGQHILGSDIEKYKELVQALIDMLQAFGVPANELDHCLFANLVSAAYFDFDKLLQTMSGSEFTELIEQKKYKEAAELLRNALPGEVGEDAARAIEALGSDVDNPDEDDETATDESSFYNELGDITNNECNTFDSCQQWAQDNEKTFTTSYGDTEMFFTSDGYAGYKDAFGDTVYVQDSNGQAWEAQPDGSWIVTDPNGTRIRTFGDPPYVPDDYTMPVIK